MTEEERMGPYHEVLLLEHPAKGTPYFSADAYYACTGGNEICEKVTFADDFLQMIFLTPLSSIDTLFPEADGKTAQSRKGIDRCSYTQFDAAGVQKLEKLLEVWRQMFALAPEQVSLAVEKMDSVPQATVSRVILLQKLDALKELCTAYLAASQTHYFMHLGV